MSRDKTMYNCAFKHVGQGYIFFWTDRNWKDRLFLHKLIKFICKVAHKNESANYLLERVSVKFFHSWNKYCKINQNPEVSTAWTQQFYTKKKEICSNLLKSWDWFLNHLVCEITQYLLYLSNLQRYLLLLCFYSYVLFILIKQMFER